MEKKMEETIEGKGENMKNKERFSIVDSIRFLSGYILPYGKHFAAFYTGWLFETILSVLLPKLLGIMLDQIVYGRDLEEFLKVSAVAAGMSLYSCVLYYWLYAQHHYLMIMFTFQIKIAVFEKFLKMQPVKLKSFRSGEIIALIQDYPAECMHFLIRGVIHQINNVVLIAAVLVFSFRISTFVGAALLILSAVCGVVTVLSGNRTEKSSVRQRETYGNYIGWLFEILENQVLIRLAGAQEKVKNHLEDFSRKLFWERNRMEWIKVLSEHLIKGLILLSRMYIFGAAVYLTGKGVMTIGTFTVVITYFEKLTDVLSDVSRKWNDAQTRAGYIRKIRDFLDRPDEADKGKIAADRLRGEIQIRNVTFSYGKNIIYKDFSLCIHSGEKVAVTGPSGSGKSTLAELLTGMLSPKKGKILIDGREIGDYTLRSFRSRIGILFQEPLITDDTLRGNLLLAKRGAAEEDLWKALEDAGLRTFAEGLPEGLDTKIREKLSGGQKQRIGIAQICLKDPDLLFLDEPTSSLDKETEQEILERLRERFREKSMILITHREAPLSICDRVIKIHSPEEKKGGNER